jgi:hypothetical protein
MSRLLLAVAVAAILLLVGAFVPVDGKTLVERWNGSPSPSRPAARSVARSPGPARTVPPAPEKPTPEPVEHHTEADRTAIDRIVAEHAGTGPAPRR